MYFNFYRTLEGVIFCEQQRPYTQTEAIDDIAAWHDSYEYVGSIDFATGAKVDFTEQVSALHAAERAEILRDLSNITYMSGRVL